MKNKSCRRAPKSRRFALEGKRNWPAAPVKAQVGRLACELRVRLYQPSDFKALQAVWLSSGIVLDDTDTAQSLERNLDRSSYRIFVGEAQRIDRLKNQPVGKPRLAGGIIATFDGHRAYIYHFAVHRDFRGLGLGRALLEASERQAQHWGARHLSLTAKTDGSRATACKLYSSASWIRDESIATFRKEIEF